MSCAAATCSWPATLQRCIAVVLGPGDFRTRTEDRPLPPPLAGGDRLRLGSLVATVERTPGHPRLVALAFDGSTVVRGLEHAARDGRLHAGAGLATQRIGAATRLAVVDAILSGMYEPGTSHYELLRAFARDASLREAAPRSRLRAPAPTSSAIRC